MGFLPVFLLGAVAAVMRDDIPLSTEQLGYAAGVFFGTGALVAAPVGRVVQQIGPRRGMGAGALVAGVAMLGMGLLARSWWHLTALLVVAGAANLTCSIASDLVVAQTVREDRRGVGFGIKTSCLPAATLLAGLAVPGVALRAGWRWTFVLAALLAAGFVVRLAVAGPRAPAALDRAAPSTRRLPVRHLTVVGFVAGLAAGAANALGAFYVDAGVAAGLSPGTAGVWLASGSLLAVFGRIALGVVADRRPRPHYGLLAVVWLVGAAGCGLLAVDGGSPVLVVGTVLAFAGGSGWTALYMHSIIAGNASAPAAASGIAMVGTFAGGVLGPLWFGTVAERVGHGGAWVATGGTLVGAALLLWAVATSRLRPLGIAASPADQDPPWRRAAGRRR
ncbi:MAG TPA: MFS transporter [Euzebyales bacterium]|nr:MFS transporter [Euzebyales bacterium]